MGTADAAAAPRGGFPGDTQNVGCGCGRAFPSPPRRSELLSNSSGALDLQGRVVCPYYAEEGTDVAFHTTAEEIGVGFFLGGCRVPDSIGAEAVAGW